MSLAYGATRPLRRRCGCSLPSVPASPRVIPAVQAPLIEFPQRSPLHRHQHAASTRDEGVATLIAALGMPPQDRSALVVPPDFSGFLRSVPCELVASRSRPWGSLGFEPAGNQVCRPSPTTDPPHKRPTLRSVPLSDSRTSLSPGREPSRRCVHRGSCACALVRSTSTSRPCSIRESVVYCPRCHEQSLDTPLGFLSMTGLSPNSNDVTVAATGTACFRSHDAGASCGASFSVKPGCSHERCFQLRFTADALCFACGEALHFRPCPCGPGACAARRPPSLFRTVAPAIRLVPCGYDVIWRPRSHPRGELIGQLAFRLSRWATSRPTPSHPSSSR